MKQYTEIVDSITTMLKRHPNIESVHYGNIDGVMNSPELSFPCVIVTPAQSNIEPRSLMNYGFQLTYLDKQREELDVAPSIIEDAMGILTSFLLVYEMDEAKINFGFGMNPIMYGYDSDNLLGVECSMLVEAIYNIDKMQSPFYKNK